MEHEKTMADALRRGDKQALGQLYDEYGATLFGLALRLTESEQAASAVLESAFQQMVAEAALFDPEKNSLFDWAVGITKKLANETGPQNDQFDFRAYQASHPAGGSIELLTRGLDEKHRRVIELAYFGGLSEEEIETKMNIPVGTVNTRLRFAVRELRKILK